MEKKYQLVYVAKQVHPNADIGTVNGSIFDTVNKAIEYIEAQKEANLAGLPWQLRVEWTTSLRIAEKTRYEAVQVRQIDNRLTGNRCVFDDRQRALDYGQAEQKATDPATASLYYWTVYTIIVPAGEWELMHNE